MLFLCTQIEQVGRSIKVVYVLAWNAVALLFSPLIQALGKEVCRCPAFSSDMEMRLWMQEFPQCARNPEFGFQIT